MKRFCPSLIKVAVFSVLLLVPFLGTARSETPIQGICAVDITPFGFSVIWQTEEDATPDITVFSGFRGREDITDRFDITLFPFHSGNPALSDDYQVEENLTALRNQAKASGLMKVRVEGCAPSTTYYYRIHSMPANGETCSRPLTGFFAATTTRENSFIDRGDQLLVTIDDQDGAIDPSGWIVTAFCEDTVSGVSSFVGDGAGENQACLNLGNLFGPDRLNWSPWGTGNFTLVIRKGGNSTPVRKKLSLAFSDPFTVSSLYTFDSDTVTGPELELQDLIIAFKILIREKTTPCICNVIDLNGDGKIDMTEIIYILEKIAGYR